MLLAELIVRHTRRHMPTRRVALEHAYLPTSGPAHGVALLAAVVATNLPAVDEEERELLTRAGRGRAQWPVDPAHRVAPPAAARRPRTRPLAAPAGRRERQARHRARRARCAGTAGTRCGARRGGAAVVGGAVLRSTRSGASSTGRWDGLSRDVEVRFVAPDMWDYVRPPLASAGAWQPGGPPHEEAWIGVAADQRWAMEVLGLRAGMSVRSRRREPPLPAHVARRASRQRRRGAARPRRASPS